jgi:hypothetical protein
MSRFTTPEKSATARERALAVAQWGGKVRVGRGADGKYHLAVVTRSASLGCAARREGSTASPAFSISGRAAPDAAGR